MLRRVGGAPSATMSSSGRSLRQPLSSGPSTRTLPSNTARRCCPRSSLLSPLSPLLAPHSSLLLAAPHRFSIAHYSLSVARCSSLSSVLHCPLLLTASAPTILQPAPLLMSPLLTGSRFPLHGSHCTAPAARTGTLEGLDRALGLAIG